jgi:hypothetical protein
MKKAESSSKVSRLDAFKPITAALQMVYSACPDLFRQVRRGYGPLARP